MLCYWSVSIAFVFCTLIDQVKGKQRAKRKEGRATTVGWRTRWMQRDGKDRVFFSIGAMLGRTDNENSGKGDDELVKRDVVTTKNVLFLVEISSNNYKPNNKNKKKERWGWKVGRMGGITTPPFFRFKVLTYKLVSSIDQFSPAQITHTQYTLTLKTEDNVQLLSSFILVTLGVVIECTLFYFPALSLYSSILLVFDSRSPRGNSQILDMNRGRESISPSTHLLLTPLSYTGTKKWAACYNGNQNNTLTSTSLP